MKMISLSPKRNLSPKPGASGGCHQNHKLMLPIFEGLLFQSIAEIALLEAESNYTRLHLTNGDQVLVCKTLSLVGAALGPYPQFVRIHRSYVVNLHVVEKYIRGKGGQLILQDGRAVNVANSRKSALMEALEYCYRPVH
jgi:two-component system LytT family response regulator